MPKSGKLSQVKEKTTREDYNIILLNNIALAPRKHGPKTNSAAAQSLSVCVVASEMKVS